MATATLCMAVQAYVQEALVSFPYDANWIQPSESDYSRQYWNAVKAQVQVLAAPQRAVHLASDTKAFAYSLASAPSLLSMTLKAFIQV